MSSVTLLLWMVLAGAPAWAYESDQLTWRDIPLQDALPAANVKMDELLSAALVDANHRTRCQGTDAAVRDVLARAVHEQVGQQTWVPARGRLPSMYFGTYAAWLESGPIERRTFTERQDIYSKVTWWKNLLLAFVGPCSTIRFGDNLLGTDKIDHFLVQGYLYYRRNGRSDEKDRAVRWGTRTERQIWGFGTTEVFSYADLSANYDGSQFYANLLGSDSVLQRGEDGCVAQVRPYDWLDWVDWTWDEVLNPSVYKEDVATALRTYLWEHRTEICAGFQAWWTAEDAERLASAIWEVFPFVAERAPDRFDPFELESLCRVAAGERVPHTEPTSEQTSGPPPEPLSVPVELPPGERVEARPEP